MGMSETESARLVRHIRLERCIEEIQADLKQYANRLPKWAMLLIGALMASAAGWLHSR